MTCLGVLDAEIQDDCNETDLKVGGVEEILTTVLLLHVSILLFYISLLTKVAF